MVGRNNQSAKAMAGTSEESQKSAQQGLVTMGRMVRSMESIASSNETIATEMNASTQKLIEIVTVIEQIGQKTQVINDIVFQTKLLSFNASVEAARAGEQGKGFAVVAEEVGNLAQMSGSAAKEISDMLSQSITTVRGIAEETREKVERLMKDGKLKIEDGLKVVRECEHLLKTIAANIDQVNRMSSEVSAASDEQSKGIEEVNKAMNQLDTVNQNNASASQQTASAATELSAQADTLRNAIMQLRQTIEGASGTTSASA